MHRIRTDRILSCSRWLALFMCLLILPLASHAAGRRNVQAAVPDDGPGAILAVDNDGDGVPVPEDCDDNRIDVHPAYPPGCTPSVTCVVEAVQELCDGRDNNCNGLSDEGFNIGAACTAGVGACQGVGQIVCTSPTTSGCNAVARPDTTICRPVAGDCDVAESCNAGVCPPDGFVPTTTSCRPAVGPCDVGESCTGASAACPPDAKQPQTTICRASAGPCDLPDSCDGINDACPADAFLPSTTTCRAAASQCDLAESCPGSGVACPADVLKPDGTACNDADQCTGPDVCTSGVCGGPALLTVSSNNLYGWYFWDDTTNTPTGTGTFVTGPGTPPLGTGSVRLTSTGATDRQVVATSGYGGTRLADITRLQYSTYRSSVDPNNVEGAMLQLEVDYDGPAGNNGWQGRLNFEPQYNTVPPQSGLVVQNTWQTWDARNGFWWATGAIGAAIPCTQANRCTLAQVVAAYPNAIIHANISGSGIPGKLLFRVGPSGQPGGFDGNADALIVGVLGVETTYDFEATDLCNDNNDCTTDTCTANACVHTALPDATTVALGDLNGWFFWNDTTDTPTGTGTFVPGPATPPLGTGSVRLRSTGATDRQVVATSGYAGTPLADITTLQYSTYRTSVDVNNVEGVMLQLEVDYDGAGGNDGWQGRLVFEPQYNTVPPQSGLVLQGTWQTWDAKNGFWWATGAIGQAIPCTQANRCTLAQVTAAYPNAVIHANIGGGNRAPGKLLFRVGPSGQPGGFDGNADALIVGVLGVNKTYDFEPTARCNDSVECTRDQCGSGVCVNPNASAGTHCGSFNDTVCDNPDTCDGAGACQVNNEPIATVCRASAGACDIVENCDGAGACPPEAFVPATTTCRPAAGDCDLAESCPGTGPACPPDAFASATTICRAVAGGCDVAESCPGTGPACPTDDRLPATTICRPTAGFCDVAESCDGTNVACPSDAFKAATLVCRPATEICDEAENCTGSSATCPADLISTTSKVCRPLAGPCDVADNCDGVNVTCPADATLPATTVCRAAAGVCDVAESCAGGPGATIYDSIPGPPLPYNRPSLGYQATQTSEFGDYITFAGTNRWVTDVTVMMSAWALHSTYPAMNPSSWTHPITLNIYDLGPGNTLGPLLKTVTQTFTIPWRPEADPTCPGGTAWRAADNNCYNGMAFDITFHVNFDVSPRNQVIIGIAYNTQTYGSPPLGVPGPYDSLNVGLRWYLNNLPPNDPGADGPVPVGTDTDTNALFWNTSTVAWYSNGTNVPPCPGGTFCRDTQWFPYHPAMRVNALPATGGDCPTDAFVPATTVCRPATGQCDLAESCPGTNAACPTDLFKAAGAVCTDNLVCTSYTGAPATPDGCQGGVDNCLGTAVTCPSDGNPCTNDVCTEARPGCGNDPICGISGVVLYNKIVAGADVPTGDPSNPVGNATMTLTGGATGSTLTSNGPVPAAGTYSFSNVAGNITDTPTRSATANDILAGLDSSDPSLISKRSVNLPPPFTPRQFKAGDVSANGTISAFDAALVSQRAVNIITSFPALGGASWFFDPINRALIVNFTPGPTNADFVGVEYGDVSMSWVGPSNPFASPRSTMPDRWLALDPTRVQQIVPGPDATATAYVSQTPRLLEDGSYEMVLGLAQADGIISLDLSLQYDPAIVTIESLTPVGLAELFAMDVNNTAAGEHAIALYCPAPMQGTGDFLVVRMRINGALTGLPLDLTGVANEGAIELLWLSAPADPETPVTPDPRQPIRLKQRTPWRGSDSPANGE